MRRALSAALAAIALALVLSGCGGERPPAPAADPGPRWRAGTRALGAAVTLAPLREQPAYRRAFLRTFTSLTPENALKWNALRPDPDEFDFGESDALVDWARRHGKRVRGHTLVWDQQLPPWLTRREWSRAELADALRRHVGTVVRRYRGRIESWDVVNEPFEDDGSWTQNLWLRALGPEYVRIALVAARRADPDARLFVNEIAAEAPGPKQDALVRLTGDLRRRGIPLDGVGLQNHTDAAGAPDAATLTRALRRLAAGGLDVEITEMDVVKDPGGPRAQAAAFAAAAGACRAVPRCTGLTVWGVTDGESWLGAPKAPLLFDRAGRAKPALPALREAWRGDGGR